MKECEDSNPNNDYPEDDRDDFGRRQIALARTELISEVGKRFCRRGWIDGGRRRRRVSSHTMLRLP